MCGAHGFRQVTGDGTGLRWNHQGDTTHDFMPSLRDRVIAGCGERQQHVVKRGLTRQLLTALDQERTTAIMQKSHIRGAKSLAKNRVAFMTGAANRIMAFISRAKSAAGHVKLAAHELTLEQINEPGSIEIRLTG